MSGRDGVSAAMVARTLILLDARGVAAEPVLAKAGLRRDALLQGRGRVPYAAVDALLESVAEHVAAAELGLALAATRDDSAYGLAGLLLVTGSTFRHGLRLALGYQRLWGDGERFSPPAAAGRCTVTFRHPGSSPLARAVLAECALAELLAGARALVDPDAVPLAVELAHEPLGEVELLARHFGVSPRHGAKVNAIHFAPDVADRPMRSMRDLLSGAIEAQCRRALAALPASSTFGSRVRDVVREFAEATPALATVAGRLKVSTRTLQRRLAREGTTFYELVDFERRARVEELIEHGAAVKETAFRAGYADPSALTRARRRWRLKTP